MLTKGPAYVRLTPRGWPTPDMLTLLPVTLKPTDDKRFPGALEAMASGNYYGMINPETGKQCVPLTEKEAAAAPWWPVDVNTDGKAIPKPVVNPETFYTRVTECLTASDELKTEHAVQVKAEADRMDAFDLLVLTPQDRIPAILQLLKA